MTQDLTTEKPVVAPASSGQAFERAAATAPARAAGLTSVVTRMTFAAPPEKIWTGLMFYEQIEQQPPWYLRALLPTPLRTEGRKSVVGDEARCIYKGGHLIKRITELDLNKLYRFEVVEQELAVGGGITLAGGEYTLRPLPDGRTEVASVTRYTCTRRPRFLWRGVEATVCHAFHRHILRAMRREIEAGAARGQVG